MSESSVPSASHITLVEFTGIGTAKVVEIVWHYRFVLASIYFVASS
jgi:hypothetical protein